MIVFILRDQVTIKVKSIPGSNFGKIPEVNNSLLTGMRALIHGAAYLRICIPMWFHRQKRCCNITAMSRYKAATMMLENQQVQIWNGILCSSFLPKNVNIPALSEKHWWTRALGRTCPCLLFCLIKLWKIAQRLWTIGRFFL